MRVDELKAKILQLAIQGKLVEQNPEDTTVAILLERIAEEKENLIKEKKIKREKLLPEIVEEEKPFDLPNGWKWVRLGDIGYTNIGLTYRPKDISDNGIPVLRSTNIQKNKIDLNDLVYVKTDIPENKICKLGDILICARNGSKKLVGKCAIINKEGMSFGAFMAIYRSDYNQYINLVLNSELFRNQLGESNTVTINQITQAMLRNTICPLPPLEEQKRIVDKVNELFTIIDELNESKEAMLKNISDLRNKVLQLAIQGKLVKQCEDDEPVAILLEGIVEEKEKLIKDKKIKKEKPLPEITEEEKLFKLPKGWGWVRLNEIYKFIDYRGKTPNKIEKGIPLVTAKNVRMGYIDYTIGEFISPEEFEERKSRGVSQKGDILFTTEAPMGNVAIADLDTFSAGQRLITLQQYTKDKLLENRLFMYFIMSKMFQNELIENKTGTTVYGIKAEKLKKILLPIPPIEEQKRILAKVDEIMSYLDEVEKTILKKVIM